MFVISVCLNTKVCDNIHVTEGGRYDHVVGIWFKGTSQSTVGLTRVDF